MRSGDFSTYYEGGSGTGAGVSWAHAGSSCLGASSFAFQRDSLTARLIYDWDSKVTFAGHAELDVSFDTSRTTLSPSTLASVEAMVRLLEDEPIEDGVTHRAEDLLAAHLANHRESGLIEAVQGAARSACAAAMLRLLGRSMSLSAPLREQIVRWGLRSTSVEIRDAAIQAVENWEDARLAKLLEAHDERVPWLRAYAALVTRNVQG